jgi:hypothetical protein
VDKQAATVGRVALASARVAAVLRSVLPPAGADQELPVGAVRVVGLVWVLRRAAAVERHVPLSAQQRQAVGVVPAVWAAVRAARISGDIEAVVQAVRISEAIVVAGPFPVRVMGLRPIVRASVAIKAWDDPNSGATAAMAAREAVAAFEAAAVADAAAEAAGAVAVVGGDRESS